MRRSIAAILGGAFLLAAVLAESAERPLSLRLGGARQMAPPAGRIAASVSTGLIEQVSPSSLTGAVTSISFQSIDTTSPPGTNPFAGRNYDGVVTPAGACAAATMCPGGETLCSGACVDTAADPNNCGACGDACAGGTTCQSGTCAAPPVSCSSDSECGTGMFCDAGTCMFQGGQGAPCTSGNECVAGLSCEPFQTSDSCMTNADCGGGSGTCTMAGCLYDLCLPVPCMAAGDCAGGFYCDTAIAGCVFQQGGAAACTSRDQCQSESCNGAAQFAERFAGQSLSFDGIFDVLSSAASGPLSLQVGAPTFNLVAEDDIGAVYLAGLGPVGYVPALPIVDPDYDGIGEGAMAALFRRDHSEVAFDVVGVDGGGLLYIDFFRRDGSLIDSLVVSTGPPLPEVITMMLAFRYTGGSDAIAGLSIYNSDPGGAGYSGFRLGSAVRTAPALSPAMLALLVLVLAAIGRMALARS